MSSHQKIKLSISGMHCRSCELTLESAIGAVPGVSSVSVSQKKGEAFISYEAMPPPHTALEQAVRTAGYEVGVGKKRPWLSRNENDYLELFMAAGTLFILYVVARVSGLTDLQFNFGASPALGVVFLVGLVAGASTCMALIGGLVLSISASHRKKHPEATRMQNFRPHLYFNTGRILGFAFLGGVAGLLGSAFKLSGSLLSVLVMLAGVVMLMLGLKLIGIFPRLEGAGLTMPKWIARLFGIRSEEKEYSHRGAVITGALTFFLPCGFTQAMQIYAISAGSFVQGALIMALFAAGTTPGLLGVGGLAAAVRGAFARIFFKFAGVIVLLLGVWNMTSGWNLTGIVLPTSVASQGGPKPMQVLPAVENGVQVVRMDQLAAGYRPNRFTVRRGVPVRWIINSENAYTCAASIVMPAYGIGQRLSAGENVIEFTPTRSGQVKFTCSMGMYSGIFNVVD